MKFLFIFLFSFFLFNPLFALDTDALSLRIAEKVQQQKPLLYSLAAKEIQNYYNRTDFSDPARSVGWYRVDDFLKWLKANEDRVSKAKITLNGISTPFKTLYEMPDKWAKPQNQQVFWAFLGMYYTTDIFSIDKDLSVIRVSLCDGGSCANADRGFLMIETEENFDIPASINLGMHETAHLLNLIKNNKKESLTELATFYVQYNYALPVKKTYPRSMHLGVRDVRREIGAGHSIPSEYNLFIAGILLNPHITKEDLFSFVDIHNFSSNIPIWEAIIHLMAANKKQFFLGNRTIRMSPDFFMTRYAKKFYITEAGLLKFKSHPDIDFFVGYFPESELFFDKESTEKIPLFVRYTTLFSEGIVLSSSRISMDKKQYLERTFGRHAKNRRLNDFYKHLLSNLNKDIWVFVLENWPTVHSEFFRNYSNKTDAYERFAKPYGKEITLAVEKALRKVGAPPPPTVPDGYM